MTKNTARDSYSIENTAEHEEIPITSGFFSKNIVVRRSLLSEGKKLFFFIGACLFVNMLAFSFPQTLLPLQVAEPFGRPIGFLIPVVGIVPLGLFAWMLRCVYDRRYLIGPDSITELSGLMSFNSRSMRIYYKNVRAIETEQNTIQRLLGIGSVRIGPLLGGGDMVLAGVSSPEQYRDMIERRMRALEIANGERRSELAGASSDS